MLYLVGLGGVSDALGVESPTKDLLDFAQETQKALVSLRKMPDFAMLSQDDRRGAEAAFDDVLGRAKEVDIWRGIVDGPHGVTRRLLADPAAVAVRADLGPGEAQHYFDVMIAEVSARLCSWLESRPFDTDTLVVAATRTLTEQNEETQQLIQELISLHRPPRDEHERELGRQRLTARAESSRALLVPDVLPLRPRLQSTDLASIGAAELPFPAVITGDGGQGKSVLLGQLFDAHIADREVILILASQVPAGAAVSTPELLDAELGRAAYGLPKAPSLTEILASRSSGGKPLLLLDTLDLILSDSSADAVIQLMALLAQLCDLVLTCRAREWEDLISPSSLRWTDLRLSGLDKDEIVDWASAYLATEDMPTDLAESFSSSVAAAANDKGRREVLAVPLRLAMACRIYAPQGALPEDLSVTRLYSTYWDTRVAHDRRGRRGQAAMDQEAAALELAGDLWHISKIRFSDCVAATTKTVRVCRTLLSEGILKAAATRYSFFHQTFAEYAVARYLATHGSVDDWEALEGVLADGSAGHWGVVTHLVVGPMDLARFEEIVVHIPRKGALGVRLLLRGALARPPEDTGPMFEDLANSHPRSLIGATDLLEEASPEWVPRVLAHANRWLADPDLRSGVLVNAVALLIRRSPKDLRPDHFRAALDALLSSPGAELPHDCRRLLNRALAETKGVVYLPSVVALYRYEDLPDAARVEVIAAQVNRPTVGADREVLAAALAAPCPTDSVDDAVALMLRCWHEPEAREALGWTSWRELLATTYPARWDAAQVRAVARIAQDDLSVLREVITTGMAHQEISRDRIHNTIDFLAGWIPRGVAAAALATRADPHREAAGTFAVLTRTVSPALNSTDRRELIDRLRRYTDYDERRVWPALVRAAIPDASLLEELLTEAAGVVDTTARQSTFRACLDELGSEGLVTHQGALRALVPSSDPADRELRAELDGYLALDDPRARAAVREHMARQPNAKEPLAAGGSIVKVLETQEVDLGPDLTNFLLDVIDSRHEHVVQTIARCLTARIGIVHWDSAAVLRIVARHQRSLQRHEDAQVAAALKGMVGALLHADKTELRELITPSVVLAVLDQYIDCLENLIANPTRKTQQLIPALYWQLQQTLTELAMPGLPLQTTETYLGKLLVDFDTAVIGERSLRALVSTLVGFSARHPTRWGTAVESRWPQMPDANKAAFPKCLKRGNLPDARVRARNLALRKDCPPEVAQALLKAFPD
ncbi:NACHT domain-containing protein [Promicromonospora sp. NFX87]|uniref:NACHT domain-containing protein n=1 Tax=Promicromonospora sp. NFX87 TaxID=3402691 RepID=UPI003AFADDDB